MTIERKEVYTCIGIQKNIAVEFVFTISNTRVCESYLIL